MLKGQRDTDAYIDAYTETPGRSFRTTVSFPEQRWLSVKLAYSVQKRKT